MIELILSALQSVMQVMVMVIFGVLLANKGYISYDRQKWLSKLNLKFFTPCLLFSNIASVVSFERLLDFWPIPVFYFIFTFSSWFICYITLPIFGLGKRYQKFVTACVLFCNSNSLPIAIISSLATSEAGKSLFWLASDSPDIVLTRGVSYTLFFGLFSNLLRWSVGYNLLQNEDDQEIFEDSHSYYPDSTYPTHNVLTNSSRKPSDTSTLISQSQSDIEECALLKNIQYNTYSSFDNANTVLKGEQFKHLPVQKKKNRWTSLLLSIHRYMSPPLYAALLAVLVGLCSPVKNLLFNQGSFLYGTVTKSIQNCGNISVPLVLICLGAQLNSIHEFQTGNSAKYRLPVALAVFLRMIVVPMLVIPLVMIFAKFGTSWSETASDPMFIVSIIIVGCMPTSINLAQITQVNGAFEEEMLNVLFWSYGVVCVPVCTIIVFIALYLVDSL